MDDKMTINEVIDAFNDFLELNWSPQNMSPSQFRQALGELDDLGMMEFEEILEAYDNFYVEMEDLSFDVHDEEFEKKFNETLNDHIKYIEEYAEDNSDGYESDDYDY